jgi:glutamine amidotransferase
MKPRVGIIDYGIGNIKSVANALNAVEAEPVLSSDPATLSACDRLILPGVGAFAHGMQALTSRGLTNFVKEIVSKGMPLLGICLGMQMLADFSTEFGVSEGLKLISGGVDKMRVSQNDGPDFRLPNVGWYELKPTGRGGELAAHLLESISPGSRFYFIHSYCMEADNRHTAATIEYLGFKYAAVVGDGLVVGTQFHPEKSGPAGLKMLKSFTH